MRSQITIKNHGFTLLEVLIALAIIAISITALLKASIQSTVITERLKEKAASHWAAMYIIKSIELGTISTNGTATNTITAIGKSFYWKAQSSPSPVKGMKKVNVQIRTQNLEKPIYDLDGFKYE